MKPSLSISQIDKLGKRLREGKTSDSDLILLQAVVAAAAGPMAKVQKVLRDELGLDSTSRLKTRDTIIEKLARDKTRLSKMQDIAGVRIVEDVTIELQDQIAHDIAAVFSIHRIDDRRISPSHGYRALHVIVTEGATSVEVQIRTMLQDLWAQAFEKLADHVGRGIRYGDRVSDPAEQRIVDLMMQLSRSCAAIETDKNLLVRMEAAGADAPFDENGPQGAADFTEYDAIRARVEESDESIRQILREFLAILEEE